MEGQGWRDGGQAKNGGGLGRRASKGGAREGVAREQGL